MFSKTSKPAPGAVTSGGSNSVQGGGIPSIISADLKVDGNLTSKGDIQVDGTVDGDVTSRGLTIGEGATVRGALKGETIRVYGTVLGTITGDSVVLAASSKVDGDVTHGTLSMEAGASFAGQIKRLQQPIGGSGSSTSTTTADPAPSTYSGTPAKPYSA